MSVSASAVRVATAMGGARAAAVVRVTEGVLGMPPMRNGPTGICELPC